MNFKEMLKDKNRYNNIFIVINKLIKIIWIILYHKIIIRKDIVWIYYNGPYK